MIKEEKAVYGQISDEEWEIIRPSKRERRNSILKFMEDNLLKVSVCSNCTTWRVESGEMWGDNLCLCCYVECIAYQSICRKKIQIFENVSVVFATFFSS
jgi:hypothetical protein